MNDYVLAVDIGGTKCAVSVVEITEKSPEIIDKKRFLTKKTYEETIRELFQVTEKLLKKNHMFQIKKIGISCGGPLNSKTGIIIGPPNLPGWINIPIVEAFEGKFGISTSLENDANAGALAEWYWGAGKGKENLVFCTFGTGMGAGFILNGQLYSGTNSLGGEIGHVRLEPDGPWGFDKNGSVEGFCSGGGIEKWGKMLAAKWLSEGKKTALAKNYCDIGEITTEKIAISANQGDELSKFIFHEMSIKLGETMSLLIDILNPELIILGSIYIRQQPLIEKTMMSVIRQEAIPDSAKVCQIVKAQLEENIGDYAAAAVARYAIEMTI